MTETPQTPLDRAWAAAADDGDAGMARYYDVLAGAELFLAIDPATLDGAAQTPVLFPVDGVKTALVFDTDWRIAEFMGDDAAHLTLSGRAVFAMFAGKGVQLGVNLGDAPSATILPAVAIDWAAEALRQPVEEEAGGAMILTRPIGATPDLLARIDAKLAGIGPALAEAWLCGAGEPDGALVLCLSLRLESAERAVVAALAETARFAGDARAAFDIAVLREHDARLAAARRVGLGFEIAAPPDTARQAPDRSLPPKLRRSP
ncbi:hypothetical protein G5B40_17425 [Pikeienuella piscinae]|uniref:SseB protein N-terminal domain-containing protein n=1 Tax=Pikeienuella piscinae TaxID=2748098 RepID=A0A7L5C439_9RHOB|nr:SseB family protein [Pikeienuella piscinae]QIE57064.1 hypothetical protein G5B40_17425 [Pikeienuella piscinae]